jgi:hypothetical protein
VSLVQIDRKRLAATGAARPSDAWLGESSAPRRLIRAQSAFRAGILGYLRRSLSSAAIISPGKSKSIARIRGRISLRSNAKRTTRAGGRWYGRRFAINDILSTREFGHACDHLSSFNRPNRPTIWRLEKRDRARQRRLGD